MHVAERAAGGQDQRVATYLVVANQTLGGEHLIDKVRECVSAGSCSFYVVVPATVPADHLWTEGEVQAKARSRLDRALARFRELGAEAAGEVGDPNPILAIEDAIRGRAIDEIILSTLPPGPSKWLKLDLPHRVREHFGLPVSHVVGDPQDE